MNKEKLILIGDIVSISTKLMETGKYFTGYTIQNDSIHGWIASQEARGIIKTLEEWMKDEVSCIAEFRDFLAVELNKNVQRLSIDQIFNEAEMTKIFTVSGKEI